MKRILFLVVMVACAATARTQTLTRTDADGALGSAKEIRGASPYVEIKNEPAPKLIAGRSS